MKCSKNLLLILTVSTLSACSSPMKLYQGEEKDKSSLAHYHLTNGYDSKYHLVTLSLDERNFQEEPPTYGQAYIQPGLHKVRVTFETFDGFILEFDQNRFQGFYEIEFTARAGYQYLPMFNLNNPKEKILSEMCMVEILQSESTGKSREPLKYDSCGKPTLEPTDSNVKLCRTLRLSGRNENFSEACNIVIEGE
ncbi:hypothetical protein QNE37_004580 [Vibrio vulnificus]|nr:hypothetical protein [Vibrio vulnificus]